MTLEILTDIQQNNDKNRIFSHHKSVDNFNTMGVYSPIEYIL